MPKVSQAYLDGRRRQIIEAALNCFSRQGFHCTTMQDIVRQSRLSFGAIYRYFKTKDEIIEAVADERHVRERELIAAASRRGEAREALLQLTHDFLEALRDPGERKQRRLGIQVWAEALRNPRMLKLVRRGMDGPRRLLAEMIRAAQERDGRAAHLDPDAAARVIISLFHGFILQQAWDRRVAVEPYVAVIKAILNAMTAQSQGALVREAGSLRSARKTGR